MKKRITYEIHGQIERNCYFRIGKALVRIEFTGGAINSTGVYPATYTTDNPLFQHTIENSEAFRKGEILRGKVENIEAPLPKEKPAEEVTDTKAVSDVANMQQARAYLMAEPYNCKLSELQNKSAIKMAALQKGVTFPNWL